MTQIQMKYDKNRQFIDRKQLQDRNCGTLKLSMYEFKLVNLLITFSQRYLQSGLRRVNKAVIFLYRTYAYISAS